MVIDGKAGGPGNLAGEAMVYVIRRCDRRIDHMDGDPQCGKPGTCQICPVDRSGTAYGIEVFGLFGVEKSGWEWKKAIGALTAVIGIIIFQK